jgi:hypothetical protein
MKTLKNILVGSLASLIVFASAQAGELTVSGSMEVSKTSLGNQDTGNGIGQENELAITGSTELDNGTTVSYKQTIGDTFGFNDSELVFGTSYGTIGVRSTGGTIEDIDNIVPTAFEEAEALWPSSTGWQDVGLTDGTMGITYANALLDTGMNLTAYYTPRASSGDGIADDGVKGTTAEDVGDGYSVTLRGNPMGIVDGLDIALGYEAIDSRVTTRTDEESVTAAVNYTYGPLKVGFQMGYLDLGRGTTVSTTGADWYKNVYAGAAYAVNDALTISYQVADSRKKTAQGESIKTEAEGFSAAYTMGGMTIAYVNNDADNANYTDGADRSAQQVVLSVAF